MLVRFAWRSAAFILLLLGALVLAFGSFGVLVNGWGDTVAHATRSLAAMGLLAGLLWSAGMLGAVVVRLMDASDSRRIRALARPIGDSVDAIVRHIDVEE